MPFEYTYTRDQAISDGILVPLSERLVFTANLFAEGYEDVEKRNQLVEKGLKLLSIPDAEDSESMKLRVIEKGRIWLIEDSSGVTFLTPDDY
jgi:hypothetical protein